MTDANLKQIINIAVPSRYAAVPLSRAGLALLRVHGGKAELYSQQDVKSGQPAGRRKSNYQSNGRIFKRSASPIITDGKKNVISSPDSNVLLRIVNKIFRTNCEDIDAIDTTATWRAIAEELMPYKQLSSTLVLRHQAGMKLKEAGRILGISGPRVNQRCEQALHKLRNPGCIMRIRNSIVGWPNLYRDLC